MRETTFSASRDARQLSSSSPLCVQGMNLADKKKEEAAYQLFLIVLPPGKGDHRIIPSLMQNAVLVLSEGTNTVSVVEIPDLTEFGRFFLADGTELVPARCQTRCTLKMAYPKQPYSYSQGHLAPSLTSFLTAVSLENVDISASCKGIASVPTAKPTTELLVEFHFLT